MQSLTSIHSFALPCLALDVLTIDSVKYLEQTLKTLKGQTAYILGEGSNTVFLQNYQGTVLRIAIKGVEVEETKDSYQLSVGSGENWHALVLKCMQGGIYGFENLALIPGTVGATPIQNIGAYGVEVERFIKSVEYLCLDTGQIKSLAHKDCEFAYRDSIFKRALAGKYVITKVVYELPKKWQAVASYGELSSLSNPSAGEILDTVIRIRQQKLPDPKLLGNAGSFFKNPVVTSAKLDELVGAYPQVPSYRVSNDNVKIPAAWLIDQLGFKGKSIGGIGCHERQPLVLVNLGNGTGDELLELARNIRKQVFDTFGITLVNEVQLIGKYGVVDL